MYQNGIYKIIKNNLQEESVMIYSQYENTK